MNKTALETVKSSLYARLIRLDGKVKAGIATKNEKSSLQAVKQAYNYCNLRLQEIKTI